MKVVSLEKVELLIEEAKTNIGILQDAKDDLIQKNVQPINELIQKKLKEISSQIREESIREVCGKDLEFIENDIAKEKDKLELLSGLIFEDDEVTEDNAAEEDSAEEMLEETNTNDEEIKQEV